MKKFLLSIFCCLMAVFSVQAQSTKEYIYDFSSNSNWVTVAGGTTAVATGSSNKLSDFYHKESGDKFDANGKGYFNAQGYFLWGKSGAYIELPTFSGEKITNITATSSSQGSTSVQVGVYSGSTVVCSPIIWSSKNTDFSYDISEEYQSSVLRLQVSSAHNAQITKLVVTTIATGEGGDTEDPDTPVVVAPDAPTLPAACNFDDAMTVEITGIAEGATAYYSLNSETDWVEGTSVEITETTTVYAKVVKDELSSDVVSATYTKNAPVTPPAEGEVVDVLTRETTGVANNGGYSDWSGKTATSSAVYAGQSAGNNDAIQLRSKNSNSGIVTTASGGKVKKIVVEWQSGTSSGRTLNIYGNNAPYSAATELYSTSTRGTLLGTIVCGTSTELVIEGDYEYIGLRSASDAMYLTSVSITWDESAGVTPVPPTSPALPAATTFKGSMMVEITGIAADATVYYTTDESDPATSATRVEYTEPFEITATTTVKAVAVNEVGASDPATATYTLFVVEETAGYYMKVVAEPADWSGKYLIVYEEAADAYVFNGVDQVNGYVSATTDGDIIKANTEIDAVAVTIAAMEGGYSIKTAYGYIYGASGSNKLNSNTSVEQLNTIELAADGVVITAGEVLQFNSASNQMRFRYYGSDQQPVQLYKYVEELPLSHTLTVSEAGWATLYLGFNARIPSAVEAYIVTTVNDGWVTLTQVTGVLPANTGVIVKAPADDYKLFNEATATVDVTGNLLDGSSYNKNVEEEAYVLSAPDGVVGLYKAEMTDGTWLNNANKAYLPASAVPNKTAAFYGFEWNGTTGVEGVVAEGAENGAIYDITGRRVKAITAPGIYIVNGKKVVK